MVEVIFAVDEVVCFFACDAATIEQASYAVGLFAEVVASRVSERAHEAVGSALAYSSLWSSSMCLREKLTGCAPGKLLRPLRCNKPLTSLRSSSVANGSSICPGIPGTDIVAGSL